MTRINPIIHIAPTLITLPMPWLARACPRGRHAPPIGATLIDTTLIDTTLIDTTLIDTMPIDAMHIEGRGQGLSWT